MRYDAVIMAILDRLARGIGTIVGRLSHWRENLRSVLPRTRRVRRIAGASDGTEDEASPVATLRPTRRTSARRAATTPDAATQTVRGRARGSRDAGEPSGAVGAAATGASGARPASSRGAATGAAATSKTAAPDRAAVEPRADDATVEPLREAARRSFVPRWLARRRTVAFNALAALGLLVFSGLTALVGLGVTAGADLAVTTALQSAQGPVLGGLMRAVSAFGFPPASLLTIGGAVGYFVLAGMRPEAAFLGLAGASSLLTVLFKTLVGRPRPDAGLVTVTSLLPDPSFPSGHVLMYVTVFGFLAYLAYALLKPGRLRTGALWVLGILVALVGPSRIWLGHHWASDVIASYALGLAYLVFLVQAYGRYRLGARPSAA